jgi:Mg2+/Co2+ transporter CorB
MEIDLGVHPGLATASAIVLLLLALSAFFSAAETALTAASRPRLHQLEKQGNRRARLVNQMRERAERAIAAMLIGNNLVNIAASALMTGLMIDLFGDAGVAYATLIMTALIVVFSEVMPKTYAIGNPDRTILTLAPPVRAMIAVLAPVSAATEALVRGFLRLMGARVRATDIDAQAEELRGAIELHTTTDTAETAAEVKQERAMLRSILDLTDVAVGEIMTHRRNLVTIDAALPAAEIVDQVLASPFTRVPLWRDEPDNIIGIINAKALLRAVRAHEGPLDKLDVEAVAVKPWFVPDTTTLLDQLQAFRERREHVALVVDEYGTLMGIVTLEDILEEIVGDIEDEHDVRIEGVRVEPDGSYLVDGTVTIRDLNRAFEWDLPDGGANTIAGLVLHEARLIPSVGQEFTFYGFRFTVMKRQRNQIRLLRMVAPKPVSEPSPAA